MPEKLPDWSQSRRYEKTGQMKAPVHSREWFAFAILGVMLVAVFGGWKSTRAKRLSFDTTQISSTQESATAPHIDKIQIKEASIDLPVEETEIRGKIWEIADDGASHLKSSANPGEPGNIVIYAHNSKERFGNLRTVKPGDAVTLVDTTGFVHEYEVANTETVTPKDSSAITQTENETLTLYTNAGFADSKRFIVQAQPTDPISDASGK